MKKTIVFSGGYTLGPVTPLLAMAEALPKQEYDFFWIGTANGPERQLVEEANIPFASIQSGKLRRYVSVHSFIDTIRIGIGILQSIRLLKTHKPALCITAGGFVSVPVHIAAKILHIPTLVHQQDIEPGLANKLMARWANIVSAATEASAIGLFGQKPVVMGNPVRLFIKKGSAVKGKQFARISSKEPVILAVGGGTGAEAINSYVRAMVPAVKGRAQVIHLSGMKRNHAALNVLAGSCDWYHHLPFLSKELPDVLASADLVISRAGFGMLTELSAVKKIAILIPKQGHQERNADHVAAHNGAIIVPEGFSQDEFMACVQQGLQMSTEQKKDMTAGLSEAIPIATAAQVQKLVTTAMK